MHKKVSQVTLFTVFKLKNIRKVKKRFISSLTKLQNMMFQMKQKWLLVYFIESLQNGLFQFKLRIRISNTNVQTRQ